MPLTNTMEAPEVLGRSGKQPWPVQIEALGQTVAHRIAGVERCAGQRPGGSVRDVLLGHIRAVLCGLNHVGGGGIDLDRQARDERVMRIFMRESPALGR